MSGMAPKCLYLFLLNREDVGPLEHVRNVCEHLRGFEIVTLSPLAETLDGTPGVHERVPVGPAGGLLSQVWRLLHFQIRASLAVLRHARGLRRDRVVILLRQSVFFFLVPLVAAASGVPLVTEVNGLLDKDLQDRGRSATARLVNRICQALTFRLSTQVVTVHENLRQELMGRFGIPPWKVRAIENGTRPRRWRAVAEAKRERGIDPATPMVGYLGSLAPREGVPELVDVFARLDVPGAELTVVGGRPEDVRVLRDRVEGRGLGSRVRLTGHLPYDEAMGWMEACDVLVHLRRPVDGGASDSQGSPLKMLDYHSAGRPVVATRLESYRYIEERGFGELVDHGNAAAAARAIEGLLAGGREDDGRRGNAWVQAHRLWRHTGDALRVVLVTALGRGSIPAVPPEVQQRGVRRPVGRTDGMHFHFLATHGLGDVVMTLPAVQALRREHPDTGLSFTVKGAAEGDLVRSCLGEDVQILSLARYRRGLRGRLRYVAELRRLGPDAVVCTVNVHPTLGAMMGILSGARYRVGRVTPRGGRLLNVTPSAPAVLHKVEGNAELLRPFVGAQEVRPLELPPFADTARRRAQELAGLPGEGVPLVVLAPGSGPLEAHKRWPSSHYATLLGRLLRVPELQVAVVGGAAEAPLAQAIFQEIPEEAGSRAVDLVGRTTVPELLSILRLARVTVSNCNGVAHLAAAVGCHVVGVYGPTDPTITGPYPPRAHTIITQGMGCSPCYQPCFLEGCGSPICMRDVTVERVEAAVLDALGLSDPSLPVSPSNPTTASA